MRLYAWTRTTLAGGAVITADAPHTQATGSSTWSSLRPCLPPLRPGSRPGSGGTGEWRTGSTRSETGTFEDRSQIHHTGQAQHVMATIRNLAVSIRCLAGATNVAKATRQAAWDPPATCTLFLTL